jgi:DNA-binding response OmpR family regulator
MRGVVVLAIGYDPVLLETRSQVLRSAGYTVVSARSLKQAIPQFLEGDFDLVVLCHSIPEEDRQRFMNLIRRHTSRTPVVFISSGFGQLDRSADVTLENDPDDLVAGLREVLSRNRERVNDRNGQGPQRPQVGR